MGYPNLLGAALAAVYVCLTFTEVQCQVIDKSPTQFAVQLEADGKFVFAWTPEEDHITIEIQVETQGYAGLGFSRSGGMRGADIILGWVDDSGEAHLYDMYGIENAAPLLDDSQDVVLLSGHRNDTHTTLRFRRPWVTCDQHHDMALSEGTVRVISAYDNARPVNITSLQHHDYRGVRSMHLLETMPVNIPSTHDIKQWDIRARNVEIPANMTTYWCSMFKFPESETKHHYIAGRPLISEESKAFVHHMILYECHAANNTASYERYVGLDGARCFTSKMPNSWLTCARPLIAWSIGGEGENLPDHIGIPLGDTWGGATYLLLEIHYENVDSKIGPIDTSGFRVFYTPKLRQHEAGLMEVGHAVGAELVLPPLSPRWPTIGHCSAACTQAALPQEGVKVIAGILHSHLLGKSMILRHIRNGTELPPILEDDTYDFNYQQHQILKEERTVLPGDHLIVECDYDTSKSIYPSFGGTGTEEEMCMVMLMIYPKTALTRCESMPVFKDVLTSVGVNSLYEDPEPYRRMIPLSILPPDPNDKQKQERYAAIENQQYEFMLLGSKAALAEDPTVSYNRWRDVTIKEPLGLQNMTLFDHLNERNLWLSGLAQKRLLEIHNKDFIQEICSGIDETPIAEFPPQPVPQFAPYVPPKRSCISPNAQVLKVGVRAETELAEEKRSSVGVVHSNNSSVGVV